MRFFLLSVLLICEPAHTSTSGNIFYDSNSGFSISKPRNWKFVSTPKTYGIQLGNDQLTTAESGLMVTFSKQMGAGFSGVKPSVGVKQLSGVRPGSNLVQWMTDELHRQQASDKYFIPGSPASPTTIDGENGARAAYVNSTVINGREVHVYHVLYAVPSGGKVYLINMNCNEDIENEFVGVFSEIAGSIHVRPNW